MFPIIFYWLPVVACLFLVAKDVYQSKEANPAYLADSKNVVKIVLTVMASFVPIVNIGLLVYFIMDVLKQDA